MEAKKLFAVVGTDARQTVAGRVLERAGYAVGGAEQVALADYIVLPLPLAMTAKSPACTLMCCVSAAVLSAVLPAYRL